VSDNPDPLDPLSDDELYQTGLTLRLACARQKSTLVGRRQKYLCYLAGLLQNEADVRGSDFPRVGPYSSGDHSHGFEA
jgi:hypothetical protein